MLESLELILRIFLGLNLLISGLDGFFHFLKFKPGNETMERFIQSCVEVKFILPLVKVLELSASIMILANFSTFFAMTVLAPIIVVISLLHLFHNKRFWSVLLTTSLPFGIFYALQIYKNLDLVRALILK